MIIGMNGILELTAVVALATILGFAAKIFKQPIILAYLLTGVIVGYLRFFHIADKETFQIFSDIGIMLLLFLIGLEINYTSLRLVGRNVFLIGSLQIIFTFLAGLALSLYVFHFNQITSAYIAAALTFSSTIIVVKILTEKKELNSLHGKIALGALLAQDIVAILLLVFLAGIAGDGALPSLNIALAFAKALLLFILTFYLGRKIFPFVFHKIADSPELLFLMSLTWLFAGSVVAQKAGFPLEIGGLLAGLSIANSAEHFQIAGRMRILRDFFILIFFTILGSAAALTNFSGLVLPIIIFSLFVILIKPLIILIIMGALGYRRRVGFLASTSLAQVSEFSLILAAFGLKLGHLDEKSAAIIAASSILSILASTYIYNHKHKIFKKIKGPLKIFERKILQESEFFIEKFEKPIVLIGCHRTGRSIMTNIDKENLLVIDFDPEVIEHLKKMGIDYIFGDISDTEVFEAANFPQVKLVISTSPELEDNLFLLSELKQLENRNQIKIILRARTELEAKALYEAGADYVLLPHFTAGQYLGKTIGIDPEFRILEQLKAQDLEAMEKNNW